MIGLPHYLILSGILFGIGAIGVMRRRNFILILLSIEIMLNAVNLSLVAFSSFGQGQGGQIASLFVIAVAASEVAIGLAVAVLFSKRKGQIDTDLVTDLKG